MLHLQTQDQPSHPLKPCSRSYDPEEKKDRVDLIVPRRKSKTSENGKENCVNN